MGKDSAIEWTTHTFNPWIGCAKVSAGCQHCYAEEMMDTRYSRVEWGIHGTRSKTAESYWKQPLRWNREAEGAAERPRVFCASLADVFEDREELHAWRAELLDLIRRTPNLDWLLLTKRPENILASMEMFHSHGRAANYADETGHMVADWRHGNPPANVWLGTSVENQEAADKRIPELLKVPATVRFLSCEPLLGPVALPCEEPRPLAESFVQGILCEDPHCARLSKHCPGEFGCRFRLPKYGERIDWVIAGGESGGKARPMQEQWARDLHSQCKAANVAFFMKQMGGVRDKRHNLEDLPEELRVREFPRFTAAGQAPLLEV